MVVHRFGSDKVLGTGEAFDSVMSTGDNRDADGRSHQPGA